MKQIKFLLLTIILTAGTFSTILYTSCRPDKCSGVNCLHGGTCSGGNCSCPAGYTGTRCESLETTELDFENNTYTRVYLTINGTSTYVDPGTYVAFYGSYGDYATGTAYTYGKTSLGTKVGLEIDWTWTTSNNIYFPSSGALSVPIDIGSNFFYLKMVNNSPQDITKIVANSGTADYVTVPHDGYVYTIGYYDALSVTTVHAESLTYVWNWTPAIPYNNNPTVTLTAN